MVKTYGLSFKPVWFIKSLKIYELNGFCDFIQCSPDDVTDTKNQTDLTSPP